MKNTLLKIGLAIALPLSAFAQQSATPVYREQSLLNGWNVAITNGMAVGPGVLNQEFTLPNGQIVFSLTNTVIAGTSQTNAFTPDAFNANGVTLAPDVNGDYVANATIHLQINNTNWIPVAITNAQGQYFTYTGATNGLPAQTIPTIPWPLAAGSGYPSWMYPATTNLYPLLPSGLTTNLLTLTFQTGWNFSVGLEQSVTVWNPTNQFTFTVDGSLGTTPGGPTVTVSTNLPATLIQTGNRIRCSSISMSLGANARTMFLINSLSVGQPKP